MPHQEIKFGGLSGLWADERVPIDRALDASDCELDDGTIRGRHGYRRAAASVVTGSADALPSTSLKGATIFTEGANRAAAFYRNYACLSGDRLTVYVDETGHLVPQIWAAGIPGSKPAGVGDATTGYPTAANITTDGQITLAANVSYGLLWGANGITAYASTESATEHRRELLTIGGGSVASDWAVHGDHADLNTAPWLRSIDAPSPSAFTVSGANAGSSPLSATSTVMYQDSFAADLLEVKHIVSLQNAASLLEKIRVKVRVEFRNPTGSTLTNIRYAYTLDCNAGITTGVTSQAIGLPADSTAFGIRSYSGSHSVGMGVYTTGSHAAGTCLAVRTTAVEASLLSNPVTGVAASLNILLGSGTAADYRNGTTVVTHTTNFQTDTAWQASSLGAAANYGLLLLTPVFDIAAGATEVFEFYIFTEEGSGYSGGDDPQLLTRYRPGTSSVTDARTVPVIGGNVWQCTDPSAETATDGVLTLVQTCFTATAKVSGAQLGKYLYLGSDTSGASWYRMKPDYTLEELKQITKGATPTSSLSTLTVQKFTDNAVFDTAAASAVGGAATATVATDYLSLSGADGAGYIYKYQSAQDWSTINWAMLLVSPPTASDGGGTCVISVATLAGNFEKIGETYDTPGGLSPVVVFCPLQGLSSATRSAVRRIQIVRNGGTASFLVHGLLPIPSAPQAGPVDYFITFYNSSTGAESPPTETVTVTFDSSAVTIPTFHSVRRHRSTYADEGYPSADPDTLPPAVMFNKSAPSPYPSRFEYAGIPTFSGNAPTATIDTVRLWRIGENGTRLVKSKATTSGSAYTITDDSGSAGLAKAAYEATGTPPPCMAMAAVGGRIIAGGDPANPSRLTISNFLPFAQDADPYPQFPSVPVKASDGQSFDIAPTASEQILWLGNGDGALYIGTNEAMYVMTDLSPFAPIGTGSEPFKVWERGVIGRRAAVWAEDRIWWVAHDGLYTARNRADVEEVSQDIRRLFRTWFLPDSSVVLGYQDRKVIAIRGTKYLRFDTVTGVWTRGTLAHTNLHPAAWRDPTGTIQQFWMLDSGGYLNRWQPGTNASDSNRATSDAGTAISAWTYSTGFDVTPVKTRGQRIFLDVSGSVAANFYKDATTSPTRTKTFSSSGQHEFAFGADMSGYMLRVGLTAANTIQVKRLMIERESTDGKGG